MTKNIKIRDAHFSPCEKYRYTLIRIQEESLPLVNFIGLNPSTADKYADDPTTHTLSHFTENLKIGGLEFGGYELTNLFACRDKGSNTLFKREKDIDIIGDENNSWLIDIAKKAEISVMMWGGNGNHNDRANKILELLRPHTKIFCFHKNNNGTPRHPMYPALHSAIYSTDGIELKPY